MSRRESLLRRSLNRLHSRVFESKFDRESIFFSKIKGMFVHYSSFTHACQMFDETPQRSLYQWNTILKHCSKERNWEEVLFLFRHIVSDGVKPDNFTVPIALKACSGLREVKYGEMVHGFVKKNGKIGSDAFVGSALIEMYLKCGKMVDALRVFDEFDRPDVVMWTTMVSGYEKNCFPDEAVNIFARIMAVGNVNPDPVTLISLVSACTQLSSLRLGRCVHGFVMRREFETDLSLLNSLLNLYAKMGALVNAVNLFRKMAEKDVISWSSIIACCAKNGAPSEAFRFFNEMMDNRVEPNAVTIVNALQACAVACDFRAGRKIHELAARKGFESDVMVSTALIDMYMRCFLPEEALGVFKRMPKKDVVSWVALISGYTQNGMAHKSIEVLHEMLLTEIQPDAILMVKVLGSCSELGFFQQAICLHGYIFRSGFDNNPFVGASLIELYSKCGNLDNAIKVFQEIIAKDVVVWSSMIAGYGIHGKGAEALKIFDQMVKSSSTRPNCVTFLSTLSACSHTGLFQEGIRIFDIMVKDYKLVPNSEHYATLVDLLGRVGELEKAIEIINKMPISPEPHIWGTLLGACRIHRNVEVAEIAAKNLFQTESDHAGYYILLSNMYGLEGKWGNMEKVRTLVKEKGIKKVVAQSSVEIRRKIHSFVADDWLHPEKETIHGLLRHMGLQMKEEIFSSDAKKLFYA